MEFRLFALDTRYNYLFAYRVVLHLDEFSIRSYVKYFTVNTRAAGRMEISITIVNYVREISDGGRNETRV